MSIGDMFKRVQKGEAPWQKRGDSKNKEQDTELPEIDPENIEGNQVYNLAKAIEQKLESGTLTPEERKKAAKDIKTIRKQMERQLPRIKIPTGRSDDYANYGFLSATHLQHELLRQIEFALTSPDELSNEQRTNTRKTLDNLERILGNPTFTKAAEADHQTQEVELLGIVPFSEESKKQLESVPEIVSELANAVRSEDPQRTYELVTKAQRTVAEYIKNNEQVLQNVKEKGPLAPAAEILLDTLNNLGLLLEKNKDTLHTPHVTDNVERSYKLIQGLINYNHEVQVDLATNKKKKGGVVNEPHNKSGLLRT